MDKIELLELIDKGESSFVEFKADTPDIKAETIGEYVVCFANSKGGKILLGGVDFIDIDDVEADTHRGWFTPDGRPLQLRLGLFL